MSFDGGDIVVRILMYIIPVLTLVCICMCCAVVRETRRTRATNLNQHSVPIANAIHHSTQQSYQSSTENTPPPPYSAESPPNFDDSLPSYEHVINRRL